MHHRSATIFTLASLLSATASLPPAAPSAGAAPPGGGSATTASVAPAPFLEQIAHVGGVVLGIFVDGNRAWVRLSAHNVSPRWVVLDLDHRPDLAVVAEVPDDDALGRVLAVRDGVMLSGATDEASRTSPALMLLDVSDPLAVSPLSRVATREHAYSAMWDGDLAYVSVGANLAVLEASDPSNARLLVQTDLVVGVPAAREGTRLYTAYQSYATCEFPDEPCPPSSVHIVDVEDPSRPSELGSLDLPWMQNQLWVGQIAGLVARDDWVMAGLDSLAVIDARDPSAPVLHHTVPADHPQGVLLRGTSVLLVESTGVRTVDVSDPAGAAESGFTPSPAEWSAVKGSALVGDDLLVADFYTDVRITQFAGPNVLSQVAAYQPVHSLEGVAVKDGVAYATDRDGSFLTFAVSPPDQSAELASVQLNPTTYRPYIAIGDSVAYVAEPDTGIQMVDVSSIGAPRPLGAFERIPGPRDVALDGEVLFVAAADGVYALDVTTPSAPTELGRWTGDESHALKVEKGLAYVAVKSGLVVLDVSNPAAIRWVSSWGGGSSWGVEVMDALGAVALLEQTPSLEASLTILDVRDPLQPELLARYGLRGWSMFHLTAVGPDKLAVAHNALEIVDLAVPADPQSVLSLPMIDALQLAFDGTDSLFAATYQGLTVFRTHPEAARGAYARYFPSVLREWRGR